MINQELLDYIKQQTQQGVSRDVINNNLISKGWQQSDVNEAFSQLTAQNTPQQTVQNVPQQIVQNMPQQTLPTSNIGDATKNGKATASLVLGIIGLFTWFIPIIGLAVNIVGLVFGIKGLKSLKRGMATAGIVLCIIGLLASVVNASIGAYLGVTGQHPIVNQMLNNK